MHVHFITIEIRIVGVAVRVVHPNSPFIGKYSSFVTHNGRLVERGLAVHQNDIASGEMAVDLLVPRSLHSPVRRCKQLVSKCCPLIQAFELEIGDLANFVFNCCGTRVFVRSVDDSLLHLPEVMVGHRLRISQLFGEHEWDTDFVGFDVGVR